MKTKARHSDAQGIEALLYQLLETELGGVQVYQAALHCAINEDLRDEWKKYLSETKHHVEIARSLLEEFGLDPDAEVPARLPVRNIGLALVDAMAVAREGSSAEVAQLTAAECVVEAETKDHMNWELVGALAEKAELTGKKALKAAHEQVEKQEDNHLHHTGVWARELWAESLGLPAVLPPEQTDQVEGASITALAKARRKDIV
ncbi:MAG TPA: hypothetical protein VIV60_05520 [Polyangiaceae bacterium]